MSTRAASGIFDGQTLAVVTAGTRLRPCSVGRDARACELCFELPWPHGAVLCMRAVSVWSITEITSQPDVASTQDFKCRKLSQFIQLLMISVFGDINRLQRRHKVLGLVNDGCFLQQGVVTFVVRKWDI